MNKWELLLSPKLVVVVVVVVLLLLLLPLLLLLLLLLLAITLHLICCCTTMVHVQYWNLRPLHIDRSNHGYRIGRRPVRYFLVCFL